MKRIAVTGLAAVLVSLAGAMATNAQDNTTFKLGGGSSAPTLTLGGADADADTLEVRGWRGGYGYGGYRGGYYGGYRGGYYGGYRGYYGGYARGYGWGGYYPRVSYYSYGYRPYYYSSYYSYYQPYVYSYYPNYCYGISDTQLTPSPKLNVQPVPPMETVPETQLKPTMPPASGPYQYDGGPSNPVPMPQGTRPGTNPRPTVPLEGRSVSLPSTTTTAKYTYPAYGQPSGGSDPLQDRTLVIKK